MPPKRDLDLDAALDTFFLYGYRKASMDDLARAAGVSRQGLYNHFSSKAEVFRATVLNIYETSVAEAEAAMADEASPVADRLLRAFDAWDGQYVDRMRVSPHTHELFDQAVADFFDEYQKAEGRIRSLVLATFAALSPGLENEIAETLVAASTGLLHIAEDRAGYCKGMEGAIRVALATGKGDAAE
ncbi:MAG: TetR/AcrR family transcriptional regulator [Acidobacteriota bacterium]